MKRETHIHGRRVFLDLPMAAVEHRRLRAVLDDQVASLIKANGWQGGLFKIQLPQKPLDIVTDPDLNVSINMVGAQFRLTSVSDGMLLEPATSSDRATVAGWTRQILQEQIDALTAWVQYGDVVVE